LNKGFEKIVLGYDQWVIMTLTRCYGSSN
jgi:hypothetical protein